MLLPTATRLLLAGKVAAKLVNIDSRTDIHVLLDLLVDNL